MFDFMLLQSSKYNTPTLFQQTWKNKKISQENSDEKKTKNKEWRLRDSAEL